MKKIVLIVSQLVLTLFLYALGALVIGIALWPAASIFVSLIDYGVTQEWVVKKFVLIGCITLAGCYFLFGLTLACVIGLLNCILRLRLKEGTYTVGHPETLKWFFVNALFLCLRTVFMDFLLLTPFCSIFYRLMGAKLGVGVQINSKNVADLSLLEIGEGSVIGGNATVIGHIFEPKGIKLMKVKIGKKVVVGLNSVIMPGVEIGDGSVIAAGAIVPKNTHIPAHTIYFSPDKQVTRTPVSSNSTNSPDNH